MTTALPTHARVVIIGGGVVGCSVAYHLAKLGWRDVLLLERKQLTSGTTWHAAGLIGQLRATANMTRLARYGAELYGNLEAETGIATGFRRVGSLSLALTSERLEELKRGASMARAYDVDVEEISVSEVARRHPLVSLDGVVGAIYLTMNNEIGIGIFSWAQGQGYGPAAIMLLMTEYGPRRFLANVAPGNEVSRAMFEKLGFKHVQDTFAHAD